MHIPPKASLQSWSRPFPQDIYYTVLNMARNIERCLPREFAAQFVKLASPDVASELIVYLTSVRGQRRAFAMQTHIFALCSQAPCSSVPVRHRAITTSASKDHRSCPVFPMYACLTAGVPVYVLAAPSAHGRWASPIPSFPGTFVCRPINGGSLI
jgi:hypothetical protein